MESKNKKKDLSASFQDFEENLHFKGSINLDDATKVNGNVFERLGFTTSINSVLKDVEQSSNIKVLSPFPHGLESSNIARPSNIGAIPMNNIAQTTLDPTLKRIKFINSLLLRVLIAAIIINFILIFIL